MTQPSTLFPLSLQKNRRCFRFKPGCHSLAGGPWRRQIVKFTTSAGPAGTAIWKAGVDCKANAASFFSNIIRLLYCRNNIVVVKLLKDLLLKVNLDCLPYLRWVLKLSKKEALLGCHCIAWIGIPQGRRGRRRAISIVVSSDSQHERRSISLYLKWARLLCNEALSSVFNTELCTLRNIRSAIWFLYLIENLLKISLIGRYRPHL